MNVQNINAQEFAPIGAKWYYGLQSQFDPNEGCPFYYYIVESVGDTIIQDKACKKLTSTSFCTGYEPNAFISTAYKDEIFMHQEGAVIELYDPFNDEFFVLMDFEAEIGEVFHLQDSANYRGFYPILYIDGEPVVVPAHYEIQDIVAEDGFFPLGTRMTLFQGSWFVGGILPYIGFITNFLGWDGIDHSDNGPFTLICYTESSELVYSADDQICSFFGYTSTSSVNLSNPKVFISNGKLNVSDLQSASYSLRLYDLQGRVLSQYSLKENFQTKLTLPNGLYIVSLTNNDGSIYTQKIHWLK